MVPAWRTSTPASRHTASKRSSGDQVAASAATVVAARPSLARFAESVLSRVSRCRRPPRKHRQARAAPSCHLRGAKIGHALSSHVSHEMGGKRRGGVLHPPRALLKTWERFDAALGQKAHASVGKHAAGHLIAQCCGSLLTVRSSGGSMRFAAAIACARSARRVTHRSQSQSGVLTRGASRLATIVVPPGDAPQHRVDELVVAPGASPIAPDARQDRSPRAAGSSKR